MKKFISFIVIFISLLTFSYIFASPRCTIEYNYKGSQNIFIKLKYESNKNYFIKGFIRESDNSLKVFYSDKKISNDEKDYILIPQSMFIIPVRVILEDVSGKEKPFSDISTSQYERYIRHLYDIGKINGYKDGTFKPKSFITREEFSAMLMSVLDIQKEKFSKYSFNDIKNSWAKDEIETLYKSNIITGFKDKKGNLIFNPKGNVTFEQAIVMVVKALKLKEGSSKKIEGASYFSYKFINAAIDNKILKQSEIKSLKFTNSATREWIAFLLSRSLVRE
ncbi:S-layer homology domain-containing protein [Caldicellulosiruptoraceae bacterium PP1]